MSGIGSVGSTSAAQYLRKLASTSSTSSDGDSDTTAADDLNQDIQAAGGTIDFQTLRGQLEAAIQSALQGSTPGDVAGATQKIKSAVETTLAAAGIDPTKLQSALAADFGEPGTIGGAPPHGGPPPVGDEGAKQSGQDILSLLDSLEQSDTNTTSLDALLGNDSSTSANTSDDLSTLLGDGGTSSSTDASTAGSSSTDDLLSQIYAQLFRNFPVGSGLDATA